jgi:hypothetical protein
MDDERDSFVPGEFGRDEERARGERVPDAFGALFAKTRVGPGVLDHGGRVLRLLCERGREEEDEEHKRG